MGLSRFLEAEVKGALVKVNGRVQPRVLEVRRAPPLDDRRVHLPFDHLPQDMLLQRVYQARQLGSIRALPSTREGGADGTYFLSPRS